jgi:hypothetical protein
MKKIKHPQTLRDLLNYYPITASRAFELAQVHRTTWKRWLSGQSNPPAATIELVRLHALGEPPVKGWEEFRFVNGKLFDPNGYGWTPEDIRGLWFTKQQASRYMDELRRNEKPSLIILP